MSRLVVTMGALGLLAGGLLGACGPTRSKCAQVDCGSGRVCDEATGTCHATDAGVTTDGGADGGSMICDPACQSPLRCDTRSGQCLECLSDADCHCPTTVCSTGGACVAPTDGGGVTVPAGGEGCATSPSVSLCGAAHFTADLTSARDDVVGRCGVASGAGKDLLWTVVLDTTADLAVTVRPSSGSLAQPVVSLRRACNADDELACVDGLGSTASFHLKSLPAGQYTLVVDTYDAASVGAVEVTVEQLPPTLPPNEACGTAAVLPLDTDVQVDLSIAEDDLQLSCNRATISPDVVYRVDLTAASDLLVTVTGAADGGADPVVGVRKAPCTAADEASCTDKLASTTERTRARNLAAGTYFVVVENYYRSGAGPVTVRAHASEPTAPPPNDTCATPRAITFAPGSNTATLVVDTSSATDTTSGSCNTEPGSPEVVYALTLAAQRLVTVSATAASGALTDAVVYLRSQNCDTGTQAACADAVPPGPDTFSVVLDPGTYFLFVEGYGSEGAGPTEVTVTLDP